MKLLRSLVFFALLASTCLVQESMAFAAKHQTASSAQQASPVHILTPVSGQTLAADFVEVRYELANPALSDEPNFLVQLDASDPVQTSETSHTFSDVQPGAHTLRVTLVDANRMPIQGGAATVQFKLTAAPPSAHDSSHEALSLPADAIAALTPSIPVPPELLANGELKLPLSGSPLPLLSLIGFGLLVGGAARTMRTP